MKIVKKFFPDGNTRFVSDIFDKTVVKFPHLSFNKIEFQIRDVNSTVMDEDNAVICLDYNHPSIREKDARSVETLITFELFRLMLKTEFPREIEDVFIGKEMIKKGLGDDLFYLYYTEMMRKKPGNLVEYVRAAVPWMTFSGEDEYNSDFLKCLLLKLSRKKYAQAAKMINLVCKKDFEKASKEYSKLFHGRTINTTQRH